MDKNVNLGGSDLLFPNICLGLKMFKIPNVAQQLFLTSEILPVLIMNHRWKSSPGMYHDRNVFGLIYIYLQLKLRGFWVVFLTVPSTLKGVIQLYYWHTAIVYIIVVGI